MTPQYVQALRSAIRILTAADGPDYETLIYSVADAIRGPSRSIQIHTVTQTCAMRAVRQLLWDRLAITEPDGSFWLLPAGWAAAENMHIIKRETAA